MPSYVRILIVGLGRWGARQLDAFLATARCEVVAVVDQQPDRAASVRGIPGFTSIEHALATVPVDAAVVVTPEVTHAPIAISLLERGLDVFVEKPLALSLSAATAVATAARTRGRVCMVGGPLEHHPGVRLIQQLAAGNAIGTVRRIESTRLATRRTTDDPWWLLAPHDLSLLLALAGRPLALATRPRHDGSVRARVSLPNHVCGTIRVGFGQPQKVRHLVVTGDNGTLELDDTAPLGRCVTVRRTGSPPEQPFVQQTAPLAAQAAAFVAAVAQGRPPERGGYPQAVEVIRWLEAGFGSPSAWATPIQS